MSSTTNSKSKQRAGINPTITLVSNEELTSLLVDTPVAASTENLKTKTKTKTKPAMQLSNSNDDESSGSDEPAKVPSKKGKKGKEPESESEAEGDSGSESSTNESDSNESESADSDEVARRLSKGKLPMKPSKQGKAPANNNNVYEDSEDDDDEAAAGSSFEIAPHGWRFRRISSVVDMSNPAPWILGSMGKSIIDNIAELPEGWVPATKDRKGLIYRIRVQFLDVHTQGQKGSQRAVYLVQEKMRYRLPTSKASGAWNSSGEIVDKVLTVVPSLLTVDKHSWKNLRNFNTSLKMWADPLDDGSFEAHAQVCVKGGKR